MFHIPMSSPHDEDNVRLRAAAGRLSGHQRERGCAREVGLASSRPRSAPSQHVALAAGFCGRGAAPHRTVCTRNGKRPDAANHPPTRDSEDCQ